MNVSETFHAAARQLHDPGARIQVPYLLVEILEGDWLAAILYCHIAERVTLQRFPSSIPLSYDDLEYALGFKQATLTRLLKKLIAWDLLLVELKQSAEHDYAPTNHYTCNFAREAELMHGLAGG